MRLVGGHGGRAPKLCSDAMRKRKQAGPPGGPIKVQRVETISVPTGRLIFKLVVGRTLTVGEYTEFLLWPGDAPAVGDHVGELVWKANRQKVELICAGRNGEACAVVVAGHYRYFGTWGMLKSPIGDVEIEPGEEVTVEIHFDLGPQPEVSPIPGRWPNSSGSESVTAKAANLAETVSTISKSVGDVAKILHP